MSAATNLERKKGSTQSTSQPHNPLAISLYSHYTSTMVCSIDNAETRTLPLAFSSPPPKTHTRGKPIRVSGYRYYNSDLGRWQSRDLAKEGVGGINLYTYVGNDSVFGIDYLGLFTMIGMPPGWPWPLSSLEMDIRAELGKCKGASGTRMTIDISEEPAGSGPAVPNNSESPRINAALDVTLDREKCLCVCEHPRFAQMARKSTWYVGLGWVSVGGWQPDGWGGPSLINGYDWYSQAKGPKFGASMNDAPGVEAGVIHGAQYKHRVEIRTRLVCQEGRAAGMVIGLVDWGVESDGYLTRKGLRYTKYWWPGGPFPMRF